ncbi:TonB family protein [Celeribacter sp.]|uniref:TonB family protein n=1 Tax=Celeribacter sp. TaxID=1890673 RepID=UPI003A8EF393
MSVWLTSRIDLLVAGLMAVGLHGAVIAHMTRVDTVIVAAAPAMAGEITVAPQDYTQMIAAWETPTQVAQSVSQQAQPQIEDLSLDVTPPEDRAPYTAPSETPPSALPDPVATLPPPMFDDTAPAPQIALPQQVPPPAIAPKPRPERPAPAAVPRTATAKPKPVSTPSKPATTSPAAAKPATAGGQGTTAGVSKAQTASLMSKWGATIRRNIQRAQRYPRAANGATGQVKLKLTVGANGALGAVSIAQGSGNPVLDQAAVAAAKSARRFPSAPKGLTQASYSFSISLKFRPN